MIEVNKNGPNDSGLVYEKAASHLTQGTFLLKHQGMIFSKILVAFSGGKDSLACILRLLQMGIDPACIELHHHEIDGREDARMKMDWPITPGYCRAVADAMRLPLYFSWREGGFEREMNRDEQATAPVHFEGPGGELTKTGGKGPTNTRGYFPQVSANLAVRRCSSSLKIDVMRRLVANSPRFDGICTLIVTGERAEESPNRARYRAFEKHPTLCTKKREVWCLRPILHWDEKSVWEIIRQYGVRPHPAYELGWGRLSCMTCIFGSANQWASIEKHFPEQFNSVAAAEYASGKTIQRTKSVRDLAKQGTCYQIGQYVEHTKRLVEMCKAEEWPEDVPVVVPPGVWEMPAGAFGEKVGPT